MTKHQLLSPLEGSQTRKTAIWLNHNSIPTAGLLVLILGTHTLSGKASNKTVVPDSSSSGKCGSLWEGRYFRTASCFRDLSSSLFMLSHTAGWWKQGPSLVSGMTLPLFPSLLLQCRPGHDFWNHSTASRDPVTSTGSTWPWPVWVPFHLKSLWWMQPLSHQLWVLSVSPSLECVPPHLAQESLQACYQRWHCSLSAAWEARPPSMAPTFLLHVSTLLFPGTRITLSLSAGHLLLHPSRPVTTAVPIPLLLQPSSPASNCLFVSLFILIPTSFMGEFSYCLGCLF